MTSEDRVVVFICTGNGRHGRRKLATWKLHRTGIAVEVRDGRRNDTNRRRSREAIERATARDWAGDDDSPHAHLPALDVTCTRCTSRPNGDSYATDGAGHFRGVRNVQASRERATWIVRTLLEAPALADRSRVVYDVSRDPASLFH